MKNKFPSTGYFLMAIIFMLVGALIASIILTPKKIDKMEISPIDMEDALIVSRGLNDTAMFIIHLGLMKTKDIIKIKEALERELERRK